MFSSRPLFAWFGVLWSAWKTATKRGPAAGNLVFSTPNTPAVAVAVLTIGELICLLRCVVRVVQMDQTMHASGWEKFSGPQVRDKTVAAVGLGRIGLQVAAYLRAFGKRAVNPMVPNPV